jgi:arsenate reductase
MNIYGITNCNTVKKSIDWLIQNDVEYHFHDYKKKGITKEKLKEWTKVVGWEKLVNKKGTSWRSLSPEQQAKVADENSAIELMLEKPSVIKRPIIEADGKLIVGFEEEEYRNSFKKK